MCFVVKHYVEITRGKVFFEMDIEALNSSNDDVGPTVYRSLSRLVSDSAVIIFKCDLKSVEGLLCEFNAIDYEKDALCLMCSKKTVDDRSG